MPPALQNAAAAAALLPPSPGDAAESRKGKCQRAGSAGGQAQGAQGPTDRAAATQRVSNVPGTFQKRAGGPLQ